jgi:hypothetical protein
MKPATKRASGPEEDVSEGWEEGSSQWSVQEEKELGGRVERPPTS